MSGEGATVPHSTRLKVGRGARENGCSYALARLASVHDALGDRGEVAGDVLATWMGQSRFWRDARCPVVNGNIVVGLVPHPLSRTFLSDLGRVACELDCGRILGARLVSMGYRLVGGVGAESGRDCAGCCRAQGRHEQPGCN